MTVLRQLDGRSDRSWDETVQLDLSYVDNRSFTSGVDVMSHTFRAVVDGRGRTESPAGGRTVPRCTPRTGAVNQPGPADQGGQDVRRLQAGFSSGNFTGWVLSPTLPKFTDVHDMRPAHGGRTDRIRPRDGSGREGNPA